LDAGARVIALNGPAEGFLNRSTKSVAGQPVAELLSIDTDLTDAILRVRRTDAPITLHGASVLVGPTPAIRCQVHMSPHEDGTLILVSPADIARRVDRASSSRTAAKSAIGMAEMLAHEIKNPLAGITGAAQLLSMNVGAEDIELTDLIVGESRRIVKLLEQVEQFGNLRPPERRSLNIHDVLDRARKSAMVGFAAHTMIVERYDPSLPPTLGDPDQLLQVFLNLLKNAAQVLKQDGTITIRTYYELSLRVRRSDGSGAAVPLQVEITDDGPGIPPDLQNNLFEPFVSGRENGTGLGLALVAKIIADHDGWISVDSRPGHTSFRLSLPLFDMKSASQATER
jgi:two-component system nitrogen regulation sensor histidine kinase GlnL